MFQTIDYVIIISFFVITLIIGIIASRTAGRSTSDYFLSNRNMPWWLLGISMVATTFASDTPNLVTELVRENGVSGNWVWWALLLTGMLTVFIYSRLWRRSGFTTDIEFYELRYGGKTASFLRGFRAVYLGFFFNILVIATVGLSAIKIGEVMFDFDPLIIIGVASLVTVLFSAIGGFKGVIYSDLLLFVISMVGAIAAAYVILGLPEVGGLSGLIEHPNVVDKLSLIPDFSDPDMYIPFLIIPLAVQWWAAWYPGAEPGGGGYVAQRMLASKNENHALIATFAFNVMHYALRPWPWIIVALGSLIMFPDLESIRAAFPSISEGKLGHDSAYPAMLTYLPAGLFGLVMTSLIAAFMSTTSTHLNWGSSYLVLDFYKRFINKNASEKEQVIVARIFTVLLMIVGGWLALKLENAKQIFDIILMFGAGTGLIFILRWFWWRINAWSEIVAMFASGIISILFNLNIFNGTSLYPESFPSWGKLPLVVAIVTVIWLVVTYLTKPESQETLKRFHNTVQAGGPGWQKVIREGNLNDNSNAKTLIPLGILCMLLGTVFIYGILFATGMLLYGNYLEGLTAIIITVVSGGLLFKYASKMMKISVSHE